MQEHRLYQTLRMLSESGIEFIVVGGLAAVLHGAPVQTYDVDVVYLRDTANIDRLLKLLAEMDAIFRIQPHRRLRPGRSHLEGGGHLNLVTAHGDLDLLGSAGQGLDYAELLPRSVEMDIGEGTQVRVLDLETIIFIKESLATEKDIAVLPTLRQTLKLARKKGEQ